MAEDKSKNEKHQAAMEKQKTKVDANIAAASTERGVSVLLTGNGKGKSSSAFGMLLRALGYKQKVAVVQFIKGAQLSGEEIFIQQHFSEIPFYQMGTGFTWDTQNREADITAAKRTWAIAEEHLRDESIDLVILDELTYMIGYDYLDEDKIISAIANRPEQQSLVVTGRGGGKKLREVVDTVSEVKDVKHAYTSGIKARKGVDY
ncbi:MAG: cob(I)alamin adenosyltransferase [Flavobacteriales bacterium]|jgi:cob(I)alamin adenosyltransferase